MPSVRIPPSRPAPPPLPLPKRVAIGNRLMSDLRAQFKREDREIRDRQDGRQAERCTPVRQAVTDMRKDYLEVLAEIARTDSFRSSAAPVEDVSPLTRRRRRHWPHPFT